MKNHPRRWSEGEISIPENKIPIARILDISAEAIVSSHVIQDKVMVEGILRYDVLYIPEDDTVIDSLDAEIGFTQYLDLPGLNPGWHPYQIKCGACGLWNGIRQKD